MYFEFESIPTAMDSTTSSPSISPMSGLSRRHRRLSSSTQSLRELIDNENVIENITPSHCDLYLITRKKLSQINTNTIKQNQDLRREVLLASIHRNITSKSTLNNTLNVFSMNELTASTPTETPIVVNRDRSVQNDSQPMSTNSDQQIKFVNMSSTTSTSTTTMANSSSGSTRLMTITTTKTTPSPIKKRNLAPTPLPNSDYEEEWKTTIKRLKVVHGLEGSPFDVSMDSEFDSGFCDNDLNDLTNNFHSLKTPFT